MPANVSSHQKPSSKIDLKIDQFIIIVDLYIHTRPLFRFRIFLFKIQNTFSQYLLFFQCLLTIQYLLNSIQNCFLT